MTDLTTWLLEQIEADEAVARAAGGGEWARGGYGPMVRDGEEVIAECGPFSFDVDHGDFANYIARNNPAATLRRCAALRATITGLQRIAVASDDRAGLVAWSAIQKLAAAYSDREGYAEAVGL